MRLLLVEDDDPIASSLKRGLEKDRYVVDVAVAYALDEADY